MHVFGDDYLKAGFPRVPYNRCSLHASNIWSSGGIEERQIQYMEFLNTMEDAS